tara:strand:+ start:317 stop:469 length:153 start_codon:yes stop_codon:yes gene_type:complete
MKVSKTDVKHDFRVKTDISAECRLKINKKVGMVCDLGKTALNQLKIFLRS